MPVGWMPEKMTCWGSLECSKVASFLLPAPWMLGVASFPPPAPWMLDVALMASEESSCRAAVPSDEPGRFRVTTVVLEYVVVVVITASSPGVAAEGTAEGDVETAAAAVDAGLWRRRLGPFASSCQALRPALQLRYIVSYCGRGIGHVPRFMFVRRVVVSLCS